MTVHRRRLVWGATALLVALLAAAMLRPTPVEVDVARLAIGPLEATVNADGITRVQDRYLLAAPVTGRLERIRLREGDAVVAGMTVARLTPLPLDPQAAAQARAQLAGVQAGMQELEARVAQAREALEQAERSATRIRNVAAAGGLSLEEVERGELRRAAAQRDHEAVQARWRATGHEVEAARAALMSLEPGVRGGVAEVRAPANGRLLRLHEQSERVVMAGTPLALIGDARTLEIVVDVLSTDAVRIEPGAPMRLVDWGGEAVLHATVSRVEPAGFTKVSALGVEEQRVNVIGQLLDPPAGLGDGYRVEARVVTWASPAVLTVPVSALFRTGDGWSVFAVEDGRARTRQVQVGERGAGEAEVRAGLAAGEAVILFPTDRVADGVRVRVRER
jgi:HlyD family secretion protein